MMPGINHESNAEFPPLQWAAKQPRHYRNRPFLALPGELRNRIYQYCLEAETIPVRKCSWDNYRAGLFRNLLLISSPEACLEFIDAYFPRSRSAVMETCRGNIIIAIPEPEPGERCYRFNVGSIMPRVATCPEINVRFELEGAVKWDQEDSTAQLNGFISCIQDKAMSRWRELAARLVFGVEFFAAIDGVGSRSRIHFFLKDFEEVANHEDDFFEWWSSVAEPPAGIVELAVSWGYSFDGHRARPLIYGSDGKSLGGEISERKGEDSGGEDPDFEDSDSEDSEHSNSSDESLYFIETLVNLPPTLERGTYTWNVHDSE